MQSPREKKDIVCRHWLKHECQRGDACAYLHEFIRDKLPECELGAKCTRQGCMFKHPPRDGKVLVLDVSDFVARVFIL